jgi:6-phosphogluconolactonase (cycloisomerase 2 family)
MTQLNKAVLLCLSCVLLVSIGGCGSSSTTTPTTPNGFLYAANSFRPGSMGAFTITTGVLGHINGSPFATTGNAPYTLAAVSTKFLYAGIPATSKGGVITRVLGRTLSGSVTGGILLMPIKSDHTLDTPQMFASGGDYDPLAVTPSGNFLYAADLTSNHLDAFSIDSSKGTLTSKGSQGPPAVGPDPFNVIVDSQGKFLFVANCDCTSPSNHGSVSVFSIASDGTLAAVPGSPFPLGGGSAHPSALAVSADSQFLFVASLDDEVYVENIAAEGTLTDASNSPVSLPSGSKPVSIALSADGGNSVYTGNAGPGTISFFLNCVQATLPAGCTGTPLPPLIFQNNTAVGGAVGVIVPDPTTSTSTSTTTATGPGHFLYVTDYDHGTIVVFAVTSTTSCTTSSCTPIPGTLTRSGSVVNTGGANPFSLAIAH